MHWDLPLQIVVQVCGAQHGPVLATSAGNFPTLQPCRLATVGARSTEIMLAAAGFNSEGAWTTQDGRDIVSVLACLKQPLSQNQIFALIRLAEHHFAFVTTPWEDEKMTVGAFCSIGSDLRKRPESEEKPMLVVLCSCQCSGHGGGSAGDSLGLKRRRDREKGPEQDERFGFASPVDGIVFLLCTANAMNNDTWKIEDGFGWNMATVVLVAASLMPERRGRCSRERPAKPERQGSKCRGELQAMGRAKLPGVTAVNVSEKMDNKTEGVTTAETVDSSCRFGGETICAQKITVKEHDDSRCSGTPTLPTMTQDESLLEVEEGIARDG